MRECLTREFVTVETPFGPVRIKVATRGTGASPTPSRSSTTARRWRRERGVATKDVQAAALKAWFDR